MVGVGFIAPTATQANVAHADGTVLGTVSMGSNTMLSAAIYDAKGQVVRHLYELAPRSGTVTLSWDGTDDQGYVLPGGNYSWRAVTSSVTGSDQGGVGVGGVVQSGQLFENVSEPGNIAAVAYGPNGDLFANSTYEELNQASVYRYSPANLPTGQLTWRSNDGFRLEGHAVAVDTQYVYVAAHADNDKDYGIYRLDASTGAIDDWTESNGTKLDHIVVSPWALDVGDTPVTGIAVDSQHLWVVDGQDNEIQVFNTADGSAAPIIGGTNTFHVTGPRGIVTDGANRFWITSSTGVTRYYYNSATQSMTAEMQTPTLGHPYGLAWDRSNGHSILYVSEIDTGEVHKYDVSGPAPVQLAAWFGSMPAGGQVSDTTFAWKYDSWSSVPGGDAAIAVSPDGKTLSVVDDQNNRTMFYDTTTGLPLSYRLQGLGDGHPMPDTNPLNNDVTDIGREYQVDYGTTVNGQHPWKLVDNWYPADNQSFQFDPMGTAIRWLDGVEYEYVYVSARCGYSSAPGCDKPNPGQLPWGGILIYRLNSNGPGLGGMKQVAEIKLDSPYGGPSTPGDNARQRMEIITDTSGDATLGGPGDTDDTTKTEGFWLGNPSMRVDAEGNIWFAGASQITGNTVPWGVGELPFQGLDSHGDPVYLTTKMSIAVPLERDPNTGAGTVPEQVAYDTTNHRVYSVVGTGSFQQLANWGGDAILMSDPGHQQQSVFSGYSTFDGPRNMLRDSVIPLAVDNTAQGYFYAASNDGPAQRVTMYTWDGLPVSRARSNLPTYMPGLFDSGDSLTAFRALDGTRYVSTEDNGYNRIGLFAFGNADFGTQRFGSDPSTSNHSGDFTWPGTSTSNNLVGWWRFDSDYGTVAQDSSGNDHLGTVLGTGSGWNPAGGIDYGALSFDGSTVSQVEFRKPFASNNPDNLIDNTAYTSGLTFATWIKTTKDGVIASYQNAVGTTGASFQAQPLLYVDNQGYLRGGTLTTSGCTQPQMASTAIVNDGNWHHVAITATGTGQTLYVDSVPVASTACGMVNTGALGFTLLGTGYTTIGSGSTATNWPNTPGGTFPYVGSLDDARIYRTALSAGDIQALAVAPQPTGPLADYSFDATSGTTLADVSDHGKDATVANGTWAPTGGRFGGALAFNGTSTQVTMPLDTAVRGPMTFSVWVKTTSGGPVFGDQTGPYPTPELIGCVACGVGPMTMQELTVNADGTVTSSFMNAGISSYLTSPPPGMTAIPKVNDGRWHNITVTASANNADSPALFDNPSSFVVSLYVNGQLANQVTTPQGVWPSMRPNGQLGAGRNHNGNWQFFSGELDELQVYSRALAPWEVANLANPPS